MIRNNALHLAGPAATNPTGEQLTPGALQAAVDQAIALWQAAGIGAEGLNRLRHLDLAIDNVSNNVLGFQFGDKIVIDADAAGYGWSRVDLVSTVTHELGHDADVVALLRKQWNQRGANIADAAIDEDAHGESHPWLLVTRECVKTESGGAARRDGLNGQGLVRAANPRFALATVASSCVGRAARSAPSEATIDKSTSPVNASSGFPGFAKRRPCPGQVRKYRQRSGTSIIDGPLCPSAVSSAVRSSAAFSARWNGTP